MQWEDESGFLEQFDVRRRSFISNLFCFAVRGTTGVHLTSVMSTTDIDEIIKRVGKECDDRLAYEWTSDEMRADCNQLRDLLHADLTRDFAQHIIDRENLTADLRQKLKGETRQKFVHKAMEAQPATEKQIDFLKFLGCKESFIGMTKARASQLIGELKPT